MRQAVQPRRGGGGSLTTSVKIERLKRRPEFLAAAKGLSAPRGAVVVQALARDGQSVVDKTAIRAGFTATRKIGGAVVRNRAKRRLREAARLLLPRFGAAGVDYVFIARNGATARPWDRLLDDVKSALISLAPTSPGHPAPGPPPPR